MYITRLFSIVTLGVTLFCCFLAGLPDSVAATTWSSSGPSGGNVNILARSASNPDVVYAGTNSGVFKSLDAGQSWTKTALPAFRVTDLAVAPGDPKVVYAGLDHGGPPLPTEDGIYKTVDGGENWLPSGLTGARVNAIAINPMTPSIVYAGTGKPESSYSGEIIGVFKSIDGGASWDNVLSGDLDAVAALQLDIENPSYVYAGVYHGDNFRKSPDAGATWVSTHVGQSNSAIVAFAMESFLAQGINQPEAVYAIVWGDNVYSSRDSTPGAMDKGENGWSLLGGGVPDVSPNPPWFLVADATAVPFIEYLGTECNFLNCDAELFKRDPFDAAYPGWTTVSTASGLPLGKPSSMSVDPRDRSLLMSLAEAGIYSSTDRGDSWSQSDQGMNNTYVNGLAVDPADPDTVLATTTIDALRLAKSNNGGTSWMYLPNSPSNLGAVSIDPNNSSTLWTGDGVHLSRSFYVHKSEDNGQSWNDIKFLTYTSSVYTSITDILINPANSDNLLVGTSGFDGVMARTLDGGLSWQQLGFAITSLAMDPNDPGIVYQGKSQIGQVFRYDNVWQSTWSSSEITPSQGIGGVRDMEVDADSRLFVAASDGLWRRDGTVWSKLTGLPTDDITALAIDLSSSPGVVFAGTGSDGVYVSVDGGDTWSAYNDGLVSLRINELRISSAFPKRLYAGTAGSGVWGRTVDITVPVPDIAVSPSSHDFGDVTEGESSNPLSISLSNTGDADLDVSSAILSDTVNYSLDVNAGANPCGAAPFTIAVNESCSLTVTFTPKSSGTKGTTLAIISNDPDESTLDVAFNGNGVQGGGNGSDDGGGGSDGGACFIATAAYGSYLDSHVKTLRAFRDKYLLTNEPGRHFVTLYYRYSPPIADYIRKHQSVRLLTRWMLTPIVYIITNPGLSGSIAFCVLVFGMWRYGRRTC